MDKEIIGHEDTALPVVAVGRPSMRSPAIAPSRTLPSTAYHTENRRRKGGVKAMPGPTKRTLFGSIIATLLAPEAIAGVADSIAGNVLSTWAQRIASRHRSNPAASLEAELQSLRGALAKELPHPELSRLQRDGIVDQALQIIVENAERLPKLFLEVRSPTRLARKLVEESSGRIAPDEGFPDHIARVLARAYSELFERSAWIDSVTPHLTQLLWEHMSSLARRPGGYGPDGALAVHAALSLSTLTFSAGSDSPRLLLHAEAPVQAKLVGRAADLVDLSEWLKASVRAKPELNPSRSAARHKSRASRVLPIPAAPT